MVPCQVLALSSETTVLDFFFPNVAGQAMCQHQCLTMGGVINHVRLLHCYNNLKIGVIILDLKIMELCHYWIRENSNQYFFYLSVLNF